MNPSIAPDEANERIRAFIAARPGGALSPEEQDEYDRLLAAWAEAVHTRAASACTP
ncbi:hypothetical protein GCM10010211_60600 [Streptomyces albospinus]|uniref:Uncharacterized protein n=1 Tax=Streptomyces albospinus TaxID=285515 RepID=A0ABQ2VGX6_9ACTN|nr:hypothetical protein [Streptomyces albospinus]GGU86420.1 hypothetical protein GCM10010211_60600 [Streptomyces albospinus]